jgi:type IV pilus assembly protein PilB
MVGEIRDEETAEISVKAAQTGHLVLATLHTNDAPKTIGRLMEIGVKPYNIAASINLITAQRLARRLCTQCKVPELDLNFTALIAAGMDEEQANGYNKVWKPYKPNPEGCDRCNKGYKGRVGIYQVMPITEGIRQIVLAGGGASEIAAQAKKEGIRDLRQSALLKYRQGVTSMAEVEATTNEE